MLELPATNLGIWSLLVNVTRNTYRVYPASAPAEAGEEEESHSRERKRALSALSSWTKMSEYLGRHIDRWA